MKKSFVLLPAMVVFTLLFTLPLQAQKFSIGGRGGLSIASYSGGSSAGFQIGPTFDVEFQKSMLLGSEFDINTQDGTPVEWANYFKYLFTVQQPNVTPYIDGGFGLWFVTGGPYFGLQVGGGAYFKVAPNLYVPADVQLGPVFATGSTVFYFAMTSGIRYNLPE